LRIANGKKAASQNRRNALRQIEKRYGVEKKEIVKPRFGDWESDLWTFRGSDPVLPSSQLAYVWAGGGRSSRASCWDALADLQGRAYHAGPDAGQLGRAMGHTQFMAVVLPAFMPKISPQTQA